MSSIVDLPKAGKLVGVLQRANQLVPVEEDKVLTIAVIGLGPVGIVSVLSLCRREGHLTRRDAIYVVWGGEPY